MKVKKIGKNFGLVAASFLGVWGLQYIGSLSGADYFTEGVMSVLLYVGVFLLLRATLENIKAIADGDARRRRIGYAFGLALLFAGT